MNRFFYAKKPSKLRKFKGLDHRQAGQHSVLGGGIVGASLGGFLLSHYFQA